MLKYKKIPALPVLDVLKKELPMNVGVKVSDNLTHFFAKQVL
jgi:hypothetical protein